MVVNDDRPIREQLWLGVRITRTGVSTRSIRETSSATFIARPAQRKRVPR